MNILPPGQEPHDELDELYRRASERDPSRPSEATRRTVLAHAERLAASRLSPPARSPRRAGWWPVAFGTLAAGILAALLVVPSHFEPPVTPAAERPPLAAPAELAATAGRAPATAPAEPAPAETVAAAGEVERPAAGRPSVPPRTPPALARRDGQRPDARSRLRPEASAPAAGKRADLLTDTAPKDAYVSNEPVMTGGRLAGAQMAAGAAARESQPQTGDALQRAAAAGDSAALDGLLQTSDVNARDSAGRTALLVAVLRGRSEAVLTLLAHGADPNAADAAGVTPLAAALARGDAVMVETLRRHGAR